MRSSTTDDGLAPRHTLEETTLFAQGLHIATWLGATLLVFCLYMIARFFQQKSGQRSLYQFFLVPVVLYLVGALYYAMPDNDFAVAPVGDVLFFGAGMTTMALASHLYSLMTGGRK